MHLDILFTTLAIILVIAGFTTILFKWLRQPLVLGYILAGFLIGSHLLVNRSYIDNHSITLWGEIGVIFLLFALGLEFNFKKLKKVGGSGAIAGLTELLFMMSTGFVLGRMIGWSNLQSIFLGGMLSISSTSIVLKAFEDLKLKSKRFTQLVFGILVVEDIIAVLLLVILSTLGISKQFNGSQLFLEFGKLLIFIFLLFSVGIYILPTLFRRFRQYLTDEILLIVSLGLCFAMVVLASVSGFSSALGAFLIGVVIAETDEQERIHRLLTPLKNLFGAVFFISVGMLVEPAIIKTHLWDIMRITLVVLLIKPITATIGFLFSGQPLKLSMQAGFSLSQIGEFSFIIASLGLSHHVISEDVYPIIVAVSILTTFATPYVINLAEPLYKFIYHFVPSSWRVVIMQYGSEINSTAKLSDWRKLLIKYSKRVIINSLWLSSILFSSVHLLLPHIISLAGEHLWVNVVVSIVTLAAMSPFIYAMTIGKTSKQIYLDLWNNQRNLRGPLITLIIIRYIISACFVGLLLAMIFKSVVLILLPALVFFILFIFISRYIKDYYTQIFNRFNNNLDKDRHLNCVSIPYDLSTDIYTEIIYVPITSDIVGYSIRNLHRKYNIGVNIVTIYRRSTRIDIPSNKELLLGDDKVLVVGNEKQILNFKEIVERDTIAPVGVDLESPEMELYKVTLTNKSPLVGLHAHISEIRDKFHILLVGYVSDDLKFHRPNPHYIFTEEDTVWILGDKEFVESII